MGVDRLFEAIVAKRSFLCVGLDTDPNRLPEVFLGHRDPIFAFNRAIIDATADFCVAYKPNVAFYEAEGGRGWDALARTVAYIKQQYPGILTIADAKRGDIANTAALYARSLFREMDFDAVTLAPYMGHDTVNPFLEYEGKWVILLALTSNPSYSEFQMAPCGSTGEALFEYVLRTSKSWGHEGNMMYVVGATRAELMERVRAIVPGHFLLVPGVGQQGGNLETVAQHGLNNRCGLLVNSSRGIIYADSTRLFADAARMQAQTIQQQMSTILEKAGLVPALGDNPWEKE